MSPFHRITFPASSLIETRTIDLSSKTEKEEKKKIKRETSGEHTRIAIIRRERSFASEKILLNSSSNNSSGGGGGGGGGDMVVVMVVVVVVVVVVVHTRLVHDRIARERNIGRVLHSVLVDFTADDHGS